ncbi:MAG: UDP-glucuronic acid decarboxylase family protein [Aquificaceae bacterium]
MKGHLNVLITGCAGFIGSHLCEMFISEGHNVIGMDNFLTGSEDNIAHLLRDRRFDFIHYNVVNYIYVQGRIDLVIHLACPASPEDYARHPIHTMKVDSLGTFNTLGLAKQKGARYLFASSSEIYGQAQVHPQPESYFGYVNPTGPRSVYSEAKRFSEALCMAYHRQHSIDVRIARIFNTYGPRMRLSDGRVVPSFISSALKGEPLKIHGDGTQTRSFCYIEDMVLGLYLLSTKEDISGIIINLGSPDEISILDLAREILKISSSSSKIIHLDSRPEDPQRRCPDITLAKTLLGWNPTTDIKTGLSKTINFFKDKTAP